MELDSMASSIGVSVPVLRFLLCFAATGAFLSSLSFGFSANLHYIVPMLLGYASMLLCRNYCGVLTFFLAFAYLIG
ncbi:lysophospholipid acyltransferase 1-like [Salvia divinorum]|uniref:Lysophospholipid acyltransferase 1-like n=1 Tax=Salvia divinorum TaxID=28513 RepID=A0ABD1IL10_SALDI